MAYVKHLRVTIKRTDATELATLFVKTYKPRLYYFASETGEKGAEHMHAHLEFDLDVPKQTVSSFMKRNGYAGKYCYQQLKKTVEANLSYCGKDGDMIIHNLSDEAYDDFIEKQEQINIDKQKDIKLKLVEHFKIRCKDKDLDLNDLCYEIVNIYVDKYDKLPPPRHLIMAYSIYVSKKLMINKQQITDYCNAFF